MSEATVREKPVLFAGPMVQAIQSGRKTQTRRLINPQPQQDKNNPSEWRLPRGRNGCSTNCRMLEVRSVPTGKRISRNEYYMPVDKWLEERLTYRVGDVLYVRETWGKGWDSGAGFYTVLQPSGADRPDKVFYRADGIECPSGGRWQPSIHMPKWAARLFLEVTAVKVERLQDISEEDAIAEGLDVDTCAAIFRKAAGKVRTEWEHWLENDETGECDDSNFCYDCARHVVSCDKWRSQHGEDRDGYKGWSIHGWREHHERDSSQWCDRCGVLLNVSLTQYGVDSELCVTEAPGFCTGCCSVSGADAAIVAELAGGIGDLQPRHHGRLAQFGFATLWDSLSKPGSQWADNPYMAAYTFRKVERP